MPNRIIKESICTSDSIDGLSWFEECFFYRLIVNCDDYGRMDARPPILRARLFPLKTVTDKQIEASIQSLRTAAMIDLYVVNGRSYLQLRTWDKHQQIRAHKSKFPSPDSGERIDDINCNQMISDDIKCPRNPIQSEYNPNPNPNTKRESVGEADPPTDASGFQKIYNENCPNLPDCKIITDKRKRAIKAFLKQFSRDQFETVCKKANQSAFCCGENDRGWKANFDWLFKPANFVKVLEGNYLNTETNRIRIKQETIDEKLAREAADRKRKDYEADKARDFAREHAVLPEEAEKILGVKLSILKK